MEKEAFEQVHKGQIRLSALRDEAMGIPGRETTASKEAEVGI